MRHHVVVHTIILFPSPVKLASVKDEGERQEAPSPGPWPMDSFTPNVERGEVLLDRLSTWGTWSVSVVGR